MTARLIAHLDMEAFFASVEAMHHPEWKNEPIIVCVFSGRTADSGVVSSASYDARALGVKAAMPIVQAKTLSPQGHFVPVRHETYSEISESIFTAMYGFADVVEIASIDEAYAELTQKCGSFESAEKKLRAFQENIKKDYSLTCSIGLASNKLVSKIASDEHKPNGFTLVTPDDVQSFLDPLSVKKLLGVGPKTEGELEKMGIRTILDIRRTSLSDLIKQFGSARGQWLFSSSRGIDESLLQPERERKQHSKIWTLVKDASKWEEVKELVGENAESLWNETAGKGQFFTQVSVMGVTSSLIQSSKSKTFNIPLSTREHFSQALEELYLQLMDNPLTYWRRIGIRVGGFASPPKQKRLGDF